MDMNMGMDPIDPAIANLPLSDPRCLLAHENCIAFYAGENASQDATPWAGQFEYGHWLTYYYIAILFLVFLVYLYTSWSDRHARLSHQRPAAGMGDKLRASMRYIAYRRFSTLSLHSLNLPSYGMSAFITISMVFVIALVFAERPYYRPYLGFGSPPIAIRSGLLAFACTPILIALAGKVNIVTMLTGISHEKLNVIHQFVGWATLVLSLIHAIPFFIAVSWMGSSDSQKAEFYQPLMPNEMSGVPALAILFGICVTSLPLIRRWVHETFYYTHVVLAITYLGLIFWHSWNTLDSWAYLWATIALWLTSWLMRLFQKSQATRITNEWFIGHNVILTSLPGGMTRLEVERPFDFKYRPGQHVYLRFPSISLIENHPFTLVNAPLSTSTTHIRQKSVPESEPLYFLARQRAGMTKKLSTAAAHGRSVSVWLDGPYGGVHRTIERRFDHLVLVAGGTGITACIPWLSHIVQLRASGDAACRIDLVTLVWVIRDKSHFGWVSDFLLEAVRSASSDLKIQIRLYISGDNDTNTIIGTTTKTELPNAENEANVDVETVEKDTIVANPSHKRGHSLEKESECLPSSPSSASTTSIPISPEAISTVAIGRPLLESVIPEMLNPTSAGSQSSRTFVFGCGPQGMRTDLSNACAIAQRMIISGTEGALREVALHTESFDL